MGTSSYMTHSLSLLNLEHAVSVNSPNRGSNKPGTQQFMTRIHLELANLVSEQCSVVKALRQREDLDSFIEGLTVITNHKLQIPGNDLQKQGLLPRRSSHTVYISQCVRLLVSRRLTHWEVKGASILPVKRRVCRSLQQNTRTSKSLNSGPLF